MLYIGRMLYIDGTNSLVCIQYTKSPQVECMLYIDGTNSLVCMQYIKPPQVECMPHIDNLFLPTHQIIFTSYFYQKFSQLSDTLKVFLPGVWDTEEYFCQVCEIHWNDFYEVYQVHWKEYFCQMYQIHWKHFLLDGTITSKCSKWSMSSIHSTFETWCNQYIVYNIHRWIVYGIHW